MIKNILFIFLSILFSFSLTWNETKNSEEVGLESVGGFVLEFELPNVSLKCEGTFFCAKGICYKDIINIPDHTLLVDIKRDFQSDEKKYKVILNGLPNIYEYEINILTGNRFVTWGKHAVGEVFGQIDRDQSSIYLVIPKEKEGKTTPLDFLYTGDCEIRKNKKLF